MRFFDLSFQSAAEAVSNDKLLVIGLRFMILLFDLVLFGLTWPVKSRAAPCDRAFTVEAARSFHEFDLADARICRRPDEKDSD